MIKRRVSQQSSGSRLFLALLAPSLIGLAACTPDKSGSSELSGSQRDLAAITTKVSTVSTGCSAEEAALFESIDGEPIDLDRDPLPRGFYLATVTEVLLEKRAEGSPIRLRVREVPGTKMNREIVCSENTGRLDPEFEMAISGVVKFDTSSSLQGTNFTTRQFHIFRDREKNDYGVVVSTPVASAASMNLKQALTGSAIGQLFRQEDKSYVMKFSRERDGYRMTMIVRLEFVPQI